MLAIAVFGLTRNRHGLPRHRPLYRQPRRLEHHALGSWLLTANCCAAGSTARVRGYGRGERGVEHAGGPDGLWGWSVLRALLPRAHARRHAQGRWLTATTVAGAFIVLAYTDRLNNSYTPEFVGIPFWVGVWVFGDWMRLRRERMAEHEERALRAEREAEREQRLAVAEERTRIARDLHDSAGHAINVILVQAGAARLLSERDPARARRALETIEEVAR